MSRAFLLREKIFECAEFDQPHMAQSMRLSQEMEAIGRKDIDWLLDDPTFTSYKDYDTGFRSPRKVSDQGAVSTAAILVSSGDLGRGPGQREQFRRVYRTEKGDNPTSGARL